MRNRTMNAMGPLDTDGNYNSSVLIQRGTRG